MRANVGHGIVTDHWHPSYQALNYANIISNFYEIMQNGGVNIVACSYLHNMPANYSAFLKDPKKFPLVKDAPCFLKDDANDFIAFLNSHICAADSSLLDDLDSCNIVSSKKLADMLVSSLQGNPFYSYDEAQSTAVETIKENVVECLKRGESRTIIVKGGPGTGKSVVALNVLGQLIQKMNCTAVYCTANAAPRNLYKQELIQGYFKRNFLSAIFKYPSVFARTSANEIDCALFDEAHRLFDFKPGVGIPGGVHILERAIEGSRVSVFFIDEDQMVTTRDFATIAKIREISGNLNKNVIESDSLKLTSQFRVLGGERYMTFIKSFLGYSNCPMRYKVDANYDFKVFDSAKDMQDAIRKKDAQERLAHGNIANVSGCCRMVAGYCYEWVSIGLDRNDTTTYDITFSDGFHAKWNLRHPLLPNDYSWLNDPLSVDEVGCIHTCQGLDLKYCGVIIGKDMIYRNGRIQFDKSCNATSDRASGIRTAPDALAEKLIRNTYNVLLTRGMKGTYVYCEDSQLRDYMKSLLDS